MKKYTTSQRLRQLMSKRGLNQADIIRLTEPYQEEVGTSMPKSAMSQYVSGTYEPDQRKLTLLSKALGVSEVWLMGYDVEESRKSKSSLIYEDADFSIYSASRKIEESQRKSLKQALLICTSPTEDRPSRDEILIWLNENVRLASFDGSNYEDRDDESLYRLYKELKDEMDGN